MTAQPSASRGGWSITSNSLVSDCADDIAGADSGLAAAEAAAGGLVLAAARDAVAGAGGVAEALLELG